MDREELKIYTTASGGGHILFAHGGSTTSFTLSPSLLTPRSKF